MRVGMKKNYGKFDTLVTDTEKMIQLATTVDHIKHTIP